MAKVLLVGGKKVRRRLNLIEKADFDAAVERALYRVHADIHDQPKTIMRVDRGDLRRSGRVRGNLLLWGHDLEYARYVENRYGFFGPKVREVAPEYVLDEARREMRDVLSG